jgi:hypothetical protein
VVLAVAAVATVATANFVHFAVVHFVRAVDRAVNHVAGAVHVSRTVDRAVDVAHRCGAVHVSVHMAHRGGAVHMAHGRRAVEVAHGSRAVHGRRTAVPAAALAGDISLRLRLDLRLCLDLHHRSVHIGVEGGAGERQRLAVEHARLRLQQRTQISV